MRARSARGGVGWNLMKPLNRLYTESESPEILALSMPGLAFRNWNGVRTFSFAIDLRFRRIRRFQQLDAQTDLRSLKHSVLKLSMTVIEDIMPRSYWQHKGLDTNFLYIQNSIWLCTVEVARKQRQNRKYAFCLSDDLQPSSLRRWPIVCSLTTRWLPTIAMASVPWQKDAQWAPNARALFPMAGGLLSLAIESD
jgi:hypothetical protein